jgi:hypothetical protein
MFAGRFGTYVAKFVKIQDVSAWRLSFRKLSYDLALIQPEEL